MILTPVSRPVELKPSNHFANKVGLGDRAAHEWYRFVLSFPPHLVREYLRRFDVGKKQLVLDPFCGTGTTLVECKKFGVPSVGIESHPMSWFASQTKLDWEADPDALMAHATSLGIAARKQLSRQGIADGDFTLARSVDGLRSLPPEAMELLLTDSICPIPLHKALVLLDQIKSDQENAFQGHELLALASALVNSISNLHFGPEVGVSFPKGDAAVIDPWLENISRMQADLKLLRNLKTASVSTTAIHADSRQLNHVLPPNSVDAVITSPPYPNEKDYTRTTRLESVLLGFIRNKTELKQVKKGLIRSNTRNIYKEDSDDLWVRENARVQQIADAIEARRLELGKTSGFEKNYAKVTKQYFGGMARHLQEMTSVLRPGAQLAYVVGDQASYLRVMLHTGQILAEIAEEIGYEVLGIDLFRTRISTVTKAQLREEVVSLRWPKNSQ